MPIISKFLDGYNTSIIMYGQTGSGKTHTMIGEEFSKTYVINEINSKTSGIIPRALYNIYHFINKNTNFSLK